MRVAIVLASLALAACTSPQARIDRAAEGVRSQPQAFQDGYRAGCESGYLAAGFGRMRFTKDTGRYDADRLYARGME